MALETSLEDLNQSYTLFPDRDLANGYELRLEAYRKAWLKCLERVEELIRALHAPVVDRVVELVNNAYTDTLPGLPYTELPVISVTASGTSSSIFDEISSRLKKEGNDGLFDDDSSGGHIITHIFPNDCPNITAAMKTLITDSVKRKPTTSLATIDINLLQAWFDAVCSTRGSDQGSMRLVVILHDFEQFEPLVVQDLFEICSLAIPRVPLVFVLSLSSPPSPSYIHATYPRSTLSRVQLRSCPFPSSQDVLHGILLQTFFDVDFEPLLMLGSSAIDFLVDFFGRHTPSLDGLVSILQLVHLKHFEEPLTVFLLDERLGSSGTTEPNLSDPASFGFLDSLFARVHESSLVPQFEHSFRWADESPGALLSSVWTARKAFQKRAKLLRIAFQLFLLVQRFMLLLGYKTDKTLPELMCGAVRGRLGSSYSHLCAMVRKLRADQLDELLSDLRDFFARVGDDVRKEENEVISRIDVARSVFRGKDEASNIAESLGDWLSEYFQQRLVSLEESPLWDIWYTGSTPFPSELLNPSLRASIFSGLLHPQDYSTTTVINEDDDDDDEEILLDMPDTSILFQRYLESGKMINVYDWFESFSVVLEAQKRRVRARKLSEDAAVLRTPSRRKGKQRQTAEEEDSPEESEEDLEKWKLEVQARFIRALHELDYIGLIKHTGRKADHVMRTVFDAPG
ncbi:hypothetical protein HYDPIDRAFT_175307 [Hydnomerulius pinastri MD-312]|uniref:Origin recognition complex subunit 3 n=1 Tax=Hydnomerulius pinastri MD-312 TaxID=994086 RepID=A0A0C9WG43_9AGAM|nr:hypothetical protein HYDPIDRAFT_175307 [Hydnomerulius pinastri MD-312]